MNERTRHMFVRSIKNVSLKRSAVRGAVPVAEAKEGEDARRRRGARGGAAAELGVARAEEGAHGRDARPGRHLVGGGRRGEGLGEGFGGRMG